MLKKIAPNRMTAALHTLCPVLPANETNELQFRTGATASFPNAAQFLMPSQILNAVRADKIHSESLSEEKSL